MANKFQKSVLERLEQEHNRKKNKSIPTEKGNAEQILQPVTEKSEKAVKETTPLKNEPKSISGEIDVVPADIAIYLRRETPRMAKNKTFYLDSDVIHAIKVTARSQKVTDSKLVNDILRKVLGLHEENH